MKYTLDTAKQAATRVHNNKYDYSNWMVYHIPSNLISILCPDHGEFTQRISNHLAGYGCKQCGTAKKSQALSVSPQKFKADAILQHGSVYDYSLWTPENVGWHKKVPIVCSIHGVFTQLLGSHIKGSGCNRCGIIAATVANTKQIPIKLQKCVAAKPVTIPNVDVSNLVYLLNTCAESIQVATSYPLDFDIYIPSSNLAIEYCGLYLNGDQFKANTYHATIHRKCKALGIQLITLFEDEWKTNTELVLAKLKYLTGNCNSFSINGRSCEIRQVSLPNKAVFFDTNHIQGNGPSSINIGLYHNDILVACMGFVTKVNGLYLLNRYATSCNVRGGFTKLLAHFKKIYQWNTIETFADLRWSTGKLYANSGFKEVYRLPPDYYWTDGKVRHHKFGFRHQHLKTKFSNYNPDLTEEQNCRANKLWKIYDCGKIKYTITRVVL